MLLCSSAAAATSQEVIAATLVLEAGGEGKEGMQAVREVIANRASNKTEKAVCLQRLQFSCWNGKGEEEGVSKAKNHPKWNLALSIANAAPTNFTNGATHYHTTKVSPSWAKRLTRTTAIKNHIFYK